MLLCVFCDDFLCGHDTHSYTSSWRRLCSELLQGNDVKWDYGSNENKNKLHVLSLNFPHQTQQTTDFIDGTNAAEEAHGHWEWTHSDEDVWSHFDGVWRIVWEKRKEKYIKANLF